MSETYNKLHLQHCTLFSINVKKCAFIINTVLDAVNGSVLSHKSVIVTIMIHY
jgi:hypothetical protein